MSHANGHLANGEGYAPRALPVADRLPPQNIEAEEGVLGSCLIDNQAIDVVAEIARPEHMYRDAHEVLYRAILAEHSEGKPVDSITIEDRMRREGTLDRAGGLDFIIQVMGRVPHSANAAYYAQIVMEKAVARDLIELHNEGLRDAYSNNFTAAELAANAETRVLAITDTRGRSEALPTSVSGARRIDRLHEMKRTGKTPGIRFGWADVDKVTGGLHPQQLVVVAARPSMGKTAFAVQICDNVSLHHNLASLFVSLEMNQDEISGRHLSLVSGVEFYRQRDPRHLNYEHLRLLGEAQAELDRRAPMVVDDTPALGCFQIASVARRLRASAGIGLVVVDYIQLVDAEDSRESRQEQVAKISRRLKRLARELNLPVMALSQLNRKAEDRDGNRPRMSDLRESGAIEQDADMVVLLHRPEYYDANDSPGVAEVILAKNRNGPTGTEKLHFKRDIMRFTGLEEYPTSGHEEAPIF